LAGEIQLAHSSTAVTLYAIARSSVGTVVKTSDGTLVSYVTANLANYTISITEQGTASRYYAGAMPASVAAGVYGVTIYQQAGGSPAEGDPVAGAGNIEWDGTAAVSLYSRLAPTTAGRMLDVSTGGEAGIDWANVGTPGSTVSLSATTVATVTTTGTATNVTNVPSAAMTESYATDGSTMTMAQALYMIWSLLAERSISGTTLTAKKIDGSTTSMAFTLDSASAPTSQTRAT